MSDRSLFPEGCAVHQRHLENESTKRIADGTRLATNAATPGILTGLVVSANSDKINVSAGTAYSPAGHFMSATAQTALSLADSTLAASNYVLLVYDELKSDYEAHTSNGTLQATLATNQPRIVILTAAAYAALPATNTILGTNAKDRAAILAVVTGMGASISLTTSNITSPDAFSSVLYGLIQSNLTGVTALQVGAGTASGSGSLVWTVGANTLSWAAPGDTAGFAEPIVTSGIVLLESNNGLTFQVDVAFSVLPTVSTTAVVTVGDLYSQVASRFSAKDVQHRSMVGAGIPSRQNPHGMTLDDLAPGAAGTLEEHQDVMHTDGIGRGSSTSALAITINTGVAPHSLTVAPFTTGDSAYINGRRVTAIVGNTTLLAPATPAAMIVQVFLSQDGALGLRSLAQHDTLALMPYLQVVNAVGVSGYCTIKIDTAGAISFDGGGSYGIASQHPAVDSLLRVYAYDKTKYIDVWAKSSALPGSLIADGITITPSVPADAIMPLANVPWSGSASGFLGYGFGASNSPNGVYDLRSYGNLDITDVSSTSGIGKDVERTAATMSDGILYEVNLPYGTTDNNLTYAEARSAQHGMVAVGLVFSYSGGSVVVGGKLTRMPPFNATFTGPASTNQVYVDHTGTMQSASTSWDAINAAQLGKPYIPIADVAVVAGVGTVTDRRTYTGYRRDMPTGVVGLNANGGVVIGEPLAGQALTVTGTAGSHAIEGIGASIGSVAGVAGIALSGTGFGVYGETISNGGIGVKGVCDGPSGFAVQAENLHVNGTAFSAVSAGNGATINSTSSSAAKTALDVTATAGALPLRVDRGGSFLDKAVEIAGGYLNVSSGGISVTNDIATSAGDITATAGSIYTAAGNVYTSVGDVRTLNGNMLLPAANNFKYATARTRRMFIPAHSFRPAMATVIAGVPVLIDTGFAGASAGTTRWLSLASDAYELVSKIAVPNGATITSVAGCWYNGTAGALSTFLRLSIMGYAGTTTIPNAAVVGTPITPSIPASNATVWVDMPVSSSTVDDNEHSVVTLMPAAAGGAFYFYGARIIYTYTDVAEAS